MTDQVHEVWLPVIGRSLAQLAFRFARMDNATLAKRASFLESLGLERSEVASILHTTNKAIAEALSKSKGAKKGKGTRAKRKAR